MPRVRNRPGQIFGQILGRFLYIVGKLGIFSAYRLDKRKTPKTLRFQGIRGLLVRSERGIRTLDMDAINGGITPFLKILGKFWTNFFEKVIDVF